VVDRIVVRGRHRPALAESFETALKLADGLAVIEYADAPAGADEKKSDKKTAKIHDKSGERILFSENSPARCPASPFPRSSRGCSRSTIPSAPARPAAASASSSISTPTWSFPTRKLTLRKGAIAPWAKSSSPYYIQTLRRSASTTSSRSTPWKDLPKKTQNADPARLRRGRDQVLL
jgi:excinuclease ABC subunit A